MLKKFTGVLLSAALIVSAVGTLTALPTTAANGSFTPQHMEVNFNDYVINDDTAGKANNTYPAKNMTSGTETKKTIWQIGEDSGNKYIYTITNSKVCNDSNPANGLYTFILNPTGKAGNSKASPPTISDSDPIYKIENGVRYRMTFRYKFQNWDKNTTTGEYNTEVKVKVGASATGVCGWNDGGARFTLQDGETALALQNTTEWKTAEFEFVANMSQGSNWGGTWMDSMMVAFIPYKVGTSTIKAQAAFNLYLDDFVVDRVASANIVKNGATETVYGAPACTEEYRAGFGTCEAEKIALPASKETYGGYADGIYTASADVPAFYSDEARENAVADPVFKAETQTLYYGNAYSTDTVKNQVAFCGFDEHNLRKSFDISGTSTASKNWDSFVRCGYRNKKWSISSAEAFTGTKSVYINTTEWDSDTTQRSRYLYVGNGYELEPGKTYNISLWVKRDTSKTQTADLNIGFVNAGDFYSPNWLKGAKILNADFKGEWQQIVFENVKIPETQSNEKYTLPYGYYMAPVLQIDSDNAFWLDTVVISEIITPGDINKDAKVNICDLVALNNAITDNETDVSYMDLNNDAAVDDKDLAELRSILLSK